MKKIIFKKLIEDVTKFFLLTSISLSLIILVVQAVSFLDYISEDGHGFVTYFGITILNLPKIYTRVIFRVKIIKFISPNEIAIII